jgi:ATP-dependent Clp protease ATP-binding subunit ClpA
MDRVIAQRLKPLLMREILFGSLKNGGSVEVEVADGSLSIR